MSDNPKAVLERPLVRYAIAVGATAASFLLRYVIVRQFGVTLPPYITFFPTIMLVAILGGLWPGVLATALAALGVDYLILGPTRQFLIANQSDAFALAIFTVMGILMSLLAERYRRARSSIEAYKLELALRRNEEELRNATEFRQLALDAADLGTWEFLPESGGVSVDRNCLKLFGFLPGEAHTNDQLPERIHPEDINSVNDAISRSIAGADDGLWGMEYRVVWPDGSIHWLSSHGQAFFSGEGDHRRAVRLIGVNMDITSRKHADYVLHESEARYRSLFDSMDEGFCIIEVIFDPKDKPTDYRFLVVNAAFERQTGLHEAAGKRMRELAPSHEEYWFETYGRIALTGESGHFVNEAQALNRNYEVRAYRVGEPKLRQVAIVFNDISDRIRAEQQIRRLNRVLSTLSDINQTIVREKDSQAMLDAACRIAVNKGHFRMAWVGMIDTKAQRLEPVASSGVVNEYLDQVRIGLQDLNAAAGPVARCLHSGEHAICNDIEHKLFRPWRDCALQNGYRSMAAFPLKIDGELTGVLCLYASELSFFDEDEVHLLDEMAMDISYALEVNRHEDEHRKGEDELRWRTALFEAQVNSALDAMLVVNSQGRKILQNLRMNELFKIPAHVSENADDAQQIEYVTGLVKNPEHFAEKVISLVSHPDEISRDEVELLDGTILDRYSAPVKGVTGDYYGRIWTFRDITEQRRLEEQLRQAQKMEAIGQLTGGIAHDFNNLLTVIMGCSEFIGREVKENPRLSRMAEMILNAANRGAEMTHRMLAFARQQALQPQSVNVNQLVIDLKSFLRRALGEGIEFDVIHGTEPCIATVDATELESALLNLCVNARDAMPGGGHLSIEVANKFLDSDYAAQNPGTKPGNYVLVSVSDTGSGISPENLVRVFEPFFTTKEVGKGTGLGLSMVYGFVKQSDGHVKIDSEPAQGTSVKLYLPHSAERTESLDQAPAAIGGSQGSEVILLVEDDLHVLEIAKAHLVSLGYRVHEAMNGKDALNILRERMDIDLLLTDIVMPGGLNGTDLAIEARRLHPSLKVLYSSGYAESAVIEQALLDKGGKLLKKPYSRSELAMSVRSALTEI